MTHIAESLINGRVDKATKGASDFTRNLSELLSRVPREVTLFNIDNVADYYWEQSKLSDGFYSQRQFPNVAPVFPLTMFEWKIPYDVRQFSLQNRVRFDGISAKIGEVWVPSESALLLIAGDMKRDEDRQRFGPYGDIGTKFWNEENAELFEKARWLCVGCPMSVDVGGTKLSVPLAVMWGVTEEGTFTENGRGESGLAWDIFSDSLERLRQVDPEAYSGQIATIVLHTCSPVWLALSFLHCKNVGTSERKIGRAARRMMERKGIPEITYHVLNIDPMKRVLKEEGGVETNGLPKALHIVRGHFADYTQGRGLFGKIHGQFYIPDHVRGLATVGTVNKDYLVQPKR